MVPRFLGMGLHAPSFKLAEGFQRVEEGGSAGVVTCLETGAHTLSPSVEGEEERFRWMIQNRRPARGAFRRAVHRPSRWGGPGKLAARRGADHLRSGLNGYLAISASESVWPTLGPGNVPSRPSTCAGGRTGPSGHRPPPPGSGPHAPGPPRSPPGDGRFPHPPSHGRSSGSRAAPPQPQAWRRRRRSMRCHGKASRLEWVNTSGPAPPSSALRCIENLQGTGTQRHPMLAVHLRPPGRDGPYTPAPGRSHPTRPSAPRPTVAAVSTRNSKG